MEQALEGFGAGVVWPGDNRERHRLAEEGLPVQLLFSVDLGVVVIGGKETFEDFRGRGTRRERSCCRYRVG